jgi:hypothetical protein
MTHFNIYKPASKNFNIGGRPDGRTHGRTDGRTDRRTDGRTDGRTDRQKSVLHRLAFASQLAKNGL